MFPPYFILRLWNSISLLFLSSVLWMNIRKHCSSLSIELFSRHWIEVTWCSISPQIRSNVLKNLKTCPPFIYIARIHTYIFVFIAREIDLTYDVIYVNIIYLIQRLLLYCKYDTSEKLFSESISFVFLFFFFSIIIKYRLFKLKLWVSIIDNLSISYYIILIYR